MLSKVSSPMSPSSLSTPSTVSGYTPSASMRIVACLDDADHTCPPGLVCDLTTLNCEEQGKTAACVDNFKGKGDCAQFKRRGFCKNGEESLVKKWCAKTCDMC
ncbi:hypothetical protein QR680_010333 [Steinernema hermaphroditum]|uniref:ShKT domain-containing protein n=1 Tax=Steinernema hermaphroditum TaxID=289476 RepID=A0AA39MBL1_9BILA|nr:hypothetical protein QR680_010333 [Steinernema hermaphroditum]